LLTFSHSFSGKKYPGLQAKIYDEFISLAKNFQVNIFTEEVSEPLTKNPRVFKIPQISIPIIQTIYRIISFSILTIIKRNDYDIVYTRTLSVHFLISGIIAKLLFKKKLVVQISGARMNAKGFRGKFFIPFLRKAIDVADIIFSNSDLVISKIENHLGIIDRQKVIIFDEGINLKNFNPDSNPKLGNVLLTVARIAPVKGIEETIKSLPYVKKEIPDISFRIVGTIDDHNYYKKLKSLIANLDCDKIVDFVGPVPNDKIKEYHNSSKIFLLTSKSEGSSISTLEAMASGMPVIVSSVGGLPDLVKDGYNGYLITNNQTQILAQKIISLLKNEELCKKIGKNARKTVEEKHSVDFFISNLTKIFNELMTG